MTAEAEQGFRPLDEASLVAYIKATPALASRLGGGSLDSIEIKEVGDGNLNFIYIVQSEAGAIVVKQALPYVRSVGDSWRMTRERAYFEASTLREHGRLCPEHTPEVYHFDRAMSLMGMRYIEPPHIILRKGLIAGVEYPLLADHMSDYMAKTLFFTSLLYNNTTDHKKGGGMRMPSWFDIHDTPITSKSVRGEEDVLRAVQIVHTMIDREIAAGTDPGDVFVFGLSQGGALSIASVLLYPKTLGGCAVFSGFLPFDSSSFAARVTDEAKKTPVLWIHGGADSLIPVQEGRDGVKFLRGLGMSCEFKEYDRLGHTLAPYELEHCERWASEIALGGGEHGRQGPATKKKGGLPGTATGSKSKLFCGVFNLLSK